MANENTQPFDLADTLVKLGVTEPVAKGLQSRINGKDLIHLINALDLDDTDKGLKVANTILAKYGIKLRVDEDTHLGLLYEKYRSGFDDMSKKNKNPHGAQFKPRNPTLVAMANRGGGGVHRSSDPARKDPFSRKAKHKKVFDESIDEILDKSQESVMYNGNSVRVKVPNGPNGTIGIIVDGKLKMVDESEIQRIDEGVLGFTQVNPLFRLRELAGIKEEVENESTDSAGFAIDDEFDFEDEFGFDTETGDLDQGPIDLPPVLDVPMDGGPVQSEAYACIEDKINDIRDLLGEVKLSEYRGLVKKLEELTNQVRSMGRDYLGERRKKF